MTDKLRTTAETVLKASGGNIKKGAPKFAALLAQPSNRALLVVLAAQYLSQLPRPRRQPPKPKGRRREGAHRRSVGTPSKHAKAGAIAALKTISHEIFARRIRGAGRLGDIRVHELRAIAESQAATATSFLQRGYDDAVESIACAIISDHCVAADPFAKVADVIPVKIAVKAFEDAKIKAAEVIRDGSAKIASDLIASARTPPMIEGSAAP
jgi:hypothetical protein